MLQKRRPNTRNYCSRNTTARSKKRLSNLGSRRSKGRKKTQGRKKRRKGSKRSSKGRLR